MSNFSDPIEQIKLLSQKLDVVIGEFNTLVDEVHGTMTAMGRMTSAALKVHSTEIEDLKRRLGVLAVHIGAAEPATQVPAAEADKDSGGNNPA